MTDTLLITKDDFNTLTAVGGNVDFNKITPHIITAQDMYLQPILGTALYEKILVDAKADTLSGEYETLVYQWVTPFLTHMTMYDYLPFQLFEIKNGGIGTHQDNNTVPAVKSDVDSLMQKYLNKAEFYKGRLHDYLCDNATSFSDYSTNSGDQMDSSEQKYSCGWVI